MAYNSSYTGVQIDNSIEKIQNIINIIYPVGSIYMSTNNVSPATFVGGTWEQIQDKFLLCAGSSYAAGTTGGEATHILSINETPSHTHTRGSMNITGGIIPAHSSGVCYYNTIGSYGALYEMGTVTNCGQSSLVGTFTGTNAIGLDASRNWTGETSSVGGSGAHNNMPPYLAVYVWKRTA